VRGELSLKKLAEKYDVTRKTDDLAEAMQKGMNWSDLDIDTRRGYLESDVRATAEIYKKQMAIFDGEASSSLSPNQRSDGRILLCSDRYRTCGYGY
jgi:hypothetical protein